MVHVGSNWKQKNTKEYNLLRLTIKSGLNKVEFLNDINWCKKAADNWKETITGIGLGLQSTPDNSNLQGKSKKEFEKNSREEGKKQFLLYSEHFNHINCRNVKWKLKDILLDYKSERNVTKHSLNRACVLLFWEEKLLHVSLWQSTSASTSKLYSYCTSIGNPRLKVSDASRRLFSQPFKGSKHGSSYWG